MQATAKKRSEQRNSPGEHVVKGEAKKLKSNLFSTSIIHPGGGGGGNPPLTLQAAFRLYQLKAKPVERTRMSVTSKHDLFFEIHRRGLILGWESVVKKQ